MKTRVRFLSFVFALIAATSAQANLIWPSLSPSLASPLFQIFGTDDYRIGDQWGKHAVTQAEIDVGGAVFRRVALATAKYGSGGTAFYLGKFNGLHVMATNYHVMEAFGCDGSPVKFPFTGKNFTCSKLFGLWTDIDLSLFAIPVSAGDEATLLGLGRNFDFDAKIYPGQKLLTLGFGIAGNPAGKLMANQDDDCKVFSQADDYRFMGDPDEYNPGPYKAWSFANGCDVSHGDSGSSFVDRETGQVVGIVWTGRVPKSPEVQSSKYLGEMLKVQSSKIWTELTYTVPAPKIREKLKEIIANGSLDELSRKTLEAVIGNRTE
ncbi:hypothetical protein WDW37_02280 [Bdellovibrionota bacterium FG-1]